MTTGEDRCPVDALRAEEFPYVETSGRAYLDHTGAALPPVSLVRGHAERVTGGVFGNPHAASPASRASTEQAEAARAAVLAFCGASADEYTVVFTANATAAIRLVAEAHLTAAAPRPLALLADNHNSVLGMRRYAATAGAPVGVVPLADDLTADWDAVAACLDTCEAAGGPGLLAYPAQSNASGVRHPLAWVRAARARGWRVLLDAAAYAPTGPLDLTAVPADFVCLSWYKITGYPPGVGCLVARHDALRALRRPWFSGGTVLASAAEADWHLPAPPPERFEDGTLPFLLLPDVTAAVAWYTAVGRAAFARHAAALTRRLLNGLGALRHPDGAPAVRLLGPGPAAERGPAVAFQLLGRDGSAVDERHCMAAASAAGVDVRSGCFCNPGVAEVANGMSREIVREALRGEGPADLDGYLRRLRVPAQGAIRASVGAATHAADVDRLLAVCAEVVAPPDPGRAGPRTGC